MSGFAAAKFLNRKGQLLIPAVLVIPTLMIFVYLLFETAKLSREKIRHQFGVDSAAFIEMTNVSDYLNRMAYVDGPFPARIFKEAFSCPPNDNYVERTDGAPHECLFDILYEMGAFPKNTGGDDANMDSLDKWPLLFSPGRGVDLNVEDPQFPSRFDLFKHARMIRLILSWEAAVGIYKLWAQVYMLLGSVEGSQRDVYERLSADFNFFRKSYYLNTSDPDCQRNPSTCGSQGLTAGPNPFVANRLKTEMKYIHDVYFAARKFVGGLDPLKVVETNPLIHMPDPGLFQLAVISNRDALARIGNPGVEVYQGWHPPGGYFMKSAEFRRYGCGQTMGTPCVHARVAAQCPRFSSGNNCVWPYPTPKYQTRLYP
ncbi:MAG: hypothetical protein WC421_07810 [Elusimicrobiales bacterium]